MEKMGSCPSSPAAFHSGRCVSAATLGSSCFRRLPANSLPVHPFAGLPDAVCKQRGRPQKPIPTVVKSHWSASNPQRCPETGVHSEEQAWFTRDCSHGCETKIQMKTACKKLEKAFGCPWHGPHGKGMSKQQEAVTNTISSIHLLG